MRSKQKINEKAFFATRVEAKKNNATRVKYFVLNLESKTIQKNFRQIVSTTGGTLPETKNFAD